MKKFYIILIFLVFSSLRVNAQNWVSIGRDSQGKEFFINIKLVEYEYADWFGVWVKYNKSEYATVKGKKIALQREVKQLMHIKCSSNEMAIVQTVVYSKSGALVKSYKDEYPDFTNVIPDTIGEVIVNNACQLKSDDKIEEETN